MSGPDASYNAPDDAPRRTPQRPAGIWTLKASQFLGSAAFSCLAKYLPVYYQKIGLNDSQIGLLQMAGMGTTFVGQFFWSAIIDGGRGYKQVLVFTQTLGTISLVFYCLDVVTSNVWYVLITAMVSQFFCSTSGCIIDALCMSTLTQWQEYKEGKQQGRMTPVTPRTVAGAQTTYGETRLYSAIGWGGMSLVMGLLIDYCGINSMFVGFGVIQATNIVIVGFFIPTPETKSDEQRAAEQNSAPQESLFQLLAKPDVMWFFANLFIYGLSMCLIENFLFIFMLQDFPKGSVSNVMLGASTTIMCLFEIPVFAKVGPWLERQPPGKNTAITGTLIGCQVILAVRCWLYAAMPQSMPWLVLPIGALHGLSFAAMWVSAMEYAKRISNPAALARMTALTSGTYNFLAMGVGCLMWGFLAEEITFLKCFIYDGAAMFVWMVIFVVGLVVLARCKKPVADQEAPLQGSI